NNPEKAEIIAQASIVVKSLVSTPESQIPDSEKTELWNKINSSVQKNSPTSTKSYSLIRWSIAAAASLALLFWLNSFRGLERVTADNGEKKEISLPESSHVIVYAGSKLVYNKNKFTDARELMLEGEAFFEVKPGSRFIVKTDQGTVTVLGTSFNVISRPGIFEVTCHTGKVLVINNAKEEMQITAGEKATTLEKQSIRRTTFFKFDDQPLSAVIDEMERQYDINIVLPDDLSKMRYTGLFESGNLTKALYEVTWPLHLHYEIKDTSAATATTAIIFR
ncbi:MAG TPA: FecR domain-containing protein, partial [Saprospiraceae bacterium]|nr:FecR domain-containing protein [Saprospiraceae bacterium]